MFVALDGLDDPCWGLLSGSLRVVALHAYDTTAELVVALWAYGIVTGWVWAMYMVSLRAMGCHVGFGVALVVGGWLSHG